MKLFGVEIRRARERRNIQDPTIPVSAAGILQYFGLDTKDAPSVTIDSAMTVPAFAAAVNFLSRSLAALPLHAYQEKKDGSAERLGGDFEYLLNSAANPECSSFEFRRYFWQQVFTGGRGVAYIERLSNKKVGGIWALDPKGVTVHLDGGRKRYQYGGKSFDAANIIDVPFFVKSDQVTAIGPVAIGRKAISLSLAMGDYGTTFFNGGGIPPLALVGPMPAGPEAVKRARDDVSQAIDNARNDGKPVPIPAGYELKQIGFDPEKGQMTEARRFQVEEIARIFNLPPIFLQDLTHASLNNAEQQDLFLVKHLVGQWAAAFEQEVNLKLFRTPGKYAEHNLDGLMRGDFINRMNGLARGVQTALLTPNEARALDNRPAMPNGDDLLIQGATVKLGDQAPKPAPQPPADPSGDPAAEPPADPPADPTTE